MDSSFSKKPKMDDLEVTGVSRSGRVRKKSSKLMDFESPDEIDRPYKKQPAANRKVHTESPLVLSDVQPKKESVQPQRPAIKIEENSNVEDRFRDDPNDSNTSDYEANIPFSNRSNTLSTDSLDSESDLDTSANTSQRIEVTGQVDNGQFQKLTDTNDDRMVIERPSIQIQGGHSAGHLTHQDANQGKNKRLVIKDGRIISRSTNQAKGVPQRKTDKAVTDRARSITTPASTPPILSHSNKKLSTVAPIKTLTSQQSTQQQRSIRTSQQVSPKSPVYQLGLPSVGNNATPNVQGVSPPSPRGSVVAGQNKSEHIFKVNGIKPIDVAAHLKLLGESLTIIGERLKEHEGQIAVSGSLSVLLDSLLCALGPLLCLTQQVPELQENCCDPEQLTSTLDNVAFIMPGL